MRIPRRSRSLRVTLLTALAAPAALALACGSDGPDAAPIPDNSPLAGAPVWVLEGCSAYWDDDDEARLCGVGSVAGTRNIALARTAAIGRARTEIARSLQTKIKAMLKDYSATTTGGEEFGTGADDEQYIEDVSKQITQLTLSGTSLQDTWVGPDGTLYTLVSLDVENFQDSLDKMTSLSETIRAAVKERADASFRELDAETN